MAYGPATEVIYFPEAENENGYGAEVTLLGLVYDNSKNKEEAYQLLRLFMEAPIADFRQPAGSIPFTYCPVNKKSAFELMANFEQQEEEFLGVTTMSGDFLFLMEKNELSVEKKEKMNDVLNKISFLYVLGNEEYFKVSEISDRYKQDRVSSYKACYIEIMQLLNPGNERWILTDEEFKEYTEEIK